MSKSEEKAVQAVGDKSWEARKGAAGAASAHKTQSLNSIVSAAKDVMNAINQLLGTASPPDGDIAKKSSLKGIDSSMRAMRVLNTAAKGPVTSPVTRMAHKVLESVAKIKVGKVDEGKSELAALMGIPSATGVHKPSGDVAQIKPGSHKVDNVS